VVESAREGFQQRGEAFVDHHWLVNKGIFESAGACAALDSASVKVFRRHGFGAKFIGSPGDFLSAPAAWRSTKGYAGIADSQPGRVDARISPYGISSGNTK